MIRTTSIAVALLTAAALAAGCGAGSHGAPAGGARQVPAAPRGPAVVVSAATSLKRAFTAYAGTLAPQKVAFFFAGSDQLAAQIRQGVKPDVFASANTKLPRDLAADGLAQPPAVFAGNRLVLAVPARGRVRSLADAARPGTSIAIGSATVPIGAYTRSVLTALGAQGKALLSNVRSEEPDVGGIAGKLRQGAVDAGFLYVTDVIAAHGALQSIRLPARVSPSVAYAAVVLKGAPHPAAAREFVNGLLHGAGVEALRKAGFEPPPPASAR